MATARNYTAPVQLSGAALITSAADLTNGSTLLSASYDNTPASGGNYTFADAELNLPSGVGVALTAEQPVELYILPAIDGTNFIDFTSNFADTAAPLAAYRGAFMVKVEASAGTAQRLWIPQIWLPPFKFKVGIRNKTGQSLKDTSHFTVNLWGYNLQG